MYEYIDTYIHVFYILADFDKAFVSIDPPDDIEYPYALNANEGIDQLFDFSSDAYGTDNCEWRDAGKKSGEGCL